MSCAEKSWLINISFMRRELQARYLSEVLDLRKQGYSIPAISAKLPVSKSAIQRWIVNFAPEYRILTLEQMARKYKEQPTQSVSESDEIKALKAEIKRLQQQLEFAEIKAEVYDKMIDIAEATFRIPIRKKSGTKQ